MKNNKEKHTPPIAEVLNLIEWGKTFLGLSQTQIEEALNIIIENSSNQLESLKKTNQGIRSGLLDLHGEVGHKMMTFIFHVTELINTNHDNRGFLTNFIKSLSNIRSIRSTTKHPDQKEIVNQVIRAVSADIEEIKKLNQITYSLYLKGRHTAVAKILSIVVPPKIAVISTESSPDSDINLGLLAITAMVLLSAIGFEQFLLKRDLNTSYTEGKVIENYFENSSYPHAGTALEIAFMIFAASPYLSSALLAYRSGSAEFTNIALSMLLISNAIAILNNVYGNFRSNGQI